ncbi:MAG TPA: hypothetical protein VFP66_05395 [Candidatus Limnocylindrales bacterium]|nr:hypothetical protein [Candidatus Limnocylindrales bacterium]
MSVAAPSIGMLRERHLHASLKRWYAEPGDQVELVVDGYVVDLVRGELLIEIQTRGFAGMRAKVIALLAAGHRIRVVHPIAVDRWIVQVDDDGASSAADARRATAISSTWLRSLWPSRNSSKIPDSRSRCY